MAKIRNQIYLSKKQLDFVKDYGLRHGIIATTGANTGGVDKSAVIRLAIDRMMEECTPSPEKADN